MSRASDQIGRGHAIEAHRFHSTLILVRVWFVFTLLGLVAGIALAFVAAARCSATLRRHARCLPLPQVGPHL